MGLFDRMFGRGAAEAQQQPNADQRFNELKQKYQTVLNAADQQGIQFQNLHVEDDKLYLKATASSDDEKNRIWEQIKLVDSNFSDITADISVAENRAQGAAVGGASGGQSYTVKSGDTLSKISKQFYGDSDEFMRIFYANRDKLNDPDMIQVGQQLTIPPDDNA